MGATGSHIGGLELHALDYAKAGETLRGDDNLGVTVVIQAVGGEVVDGAGGTVGVGNDVGGVVAAHDGFGQCVCVHIHDGGRIASGAVGLDTEGVVGGSRETGKGIVGIGDAGGDNGGVVIERIGGAIARPADANRVLADAVDSQIGDRHAGCADGDAHTVNPCVVGVAAPVVEGNLGSIGRNVGGVGLHVALAGGGVVVGTPHGVGRGDVAEPQMVVAAVGGILHSEVECAHVASVVKHGREGILVVVASRVVGAEAQGNAVAIEQGQRNVVGGVHAVGGPAAECDTGGIEALVEGHCDGTTGSVHADGCHVRGIGSRAVGHNAEGVVGVLGEAGEGVGAGGDAGGNDRVVVIDSVGGTAVVVGPTDGGTGGAKVGDFNSGHKAAGAGGVHGVEHCVGQVGAVGTSVGVGSSAVLDGERYFAVVRARSPAEDNRIVVVDIDSVGGAGLVDSEGVNITAVL